MANDQIHEVRVHLTREQAPIRKARLEMTGTDVTFGVPGWQGEHYGFEPGTVPEYPGTLDYLVASVAGCLIGTFGGTLKARGITATGDDLVADAIGEVGVDDDNVLHLRRIIVRYTLKAAPEHREAAERCNAIHAHHGPNARSVAAAARVHHSTAGVQDSIAESKQQRSSDGVGGDGGVGDVGDDGVAACLSACQEFVERALR
jgi:organic hydroperoxide reductase OsmC/OhrA